MDDVWIFGYGSLLWRPDLPFVERRVGHVRGWARRFWQGSPDHRGRPGAPGRVVTLVRRPGARCDGIAYRVRGADAAGVLARLDRREQAGYERLVERMRSPVGDVDVVAYVATPGNPNFLGPAPVDAIAAEIRVRSGPSGTNLDYALRLARALRDLGAVDEHVFAVAERLR